MELKILSNKDLKTRKKRILLAGRAGIGKTTIACAIDNACIIDIEDKARWFEDEIKIIRPNDYFDLEACLGILERAAKTKEKPKWIVIDTIDALNNIFRNHFLTKLNLSTEASDGFGRLYDIIKKEIMKFLKKIYAMDYSILLIGHVKDKDIIKEKKTYTKTMIAIPESLKYEISIWVDMVAEYEYIENNQRIIQLGSNKYTEAKSNIPNLVDSMKPEEFVNWINGDN